ncbi:MAG: glycoside hydrolase family 88 protein [Lachnospiraceae bacterium]|nr:glycoside hydrolase family 88 protein [Lachnospiraceae bacterium]
MEISNVQTPLDYAHKACDTMMRKYAPADLPPKGRFLYHQGVFLSGVLKTWRLTGRQAYLDYAAGWVDSVFTPEGKIKCYEHADLDYIQPGILLYTLLDATGDEKYLACIESVAAQIPDIPRCECGGFYHKVRCVRQMWLDGIYMLGPFAAEYARRFNKPELMNEVVKEILLMREHTRDEKTGLWYHAWDESLQASWCNSETGLAPEFWGRSIGWVPVGIQDVMAQMEPECDEYQVLSTVVKDLLESVMQFQSDDGRWYQVVNKGGQDGNWLENSCSCLFAAGLARTARMGLMGAEALDAAQRAFDGVVKSLEWDGENLLVNHVCIGTGVGDYRFYCERPCSINDLHGVGAFLLMCTELEEARRECGA